MIKIIFLADIIGKIGRKGVTKYLPILKKELRPDLVIANAENLAHGIGFTQKTLDEMTAAGVDFFTSGNHAWKKGTADEILDADDPIVIRPANYPSKKSGVGYKEFKIAQNKLIVVNLLGEVFIEDKVGNPFKAMERIIAKFGKAIYFVDLHAEATSEKTAFAQYFDGKVTAVVGTHTHVQTADERILKNGTGFITDAGMIGYYDSIIGADKKQIFNMFLGTGKSSAKHDMPETGDCQFNGIYLEIDEKKNIVSKIKRLSKIVKI
jgi:metallophosphoesterase (TIGR00282 family)